MPKFLFNAPPHHIFQYTPLDGGPMVEYHGGDVIEMPTNFGNPRFELQGDAAKVAEPEVVDVDSDSDDTDDDSTGDVATDETPEVSRQGKPWAERGQS